LVGGKKHTIINPSLLQAVDSNIEFDNVEVGATSCRSLLVYTSTSNSILYRVKENVMVLVNGEQTVLEIQEFYAVSCGDQCHTFFKGRMFVDDHRCHKHRGNCIIIATAEIVHACASQLLRKIILYPDPTENTTNSAESFVVIDYSRPNLPLCEEDILVPIFPQVGDMLEIAGDNDEVWLALAISVDTTSKTFRARFYTNNDKTMPHLFLPEGLSSRRYDTIHWALVSAVASGFWSGNNWYSV